MYVEEGVFMRCRVCGARIQLAVEGLEIKVLRVDAAVETTCRDGCRLPSGVEGIDAVVRRHQRVAPPPKARREPMEFKGDLAFMQRLNEQERGELIAAADVIALSSGKSRGEALATLGLLLRFDND